MTRQRDSHARPQRSEPTVSSASRWLVVVVFLAAAFAMIRAVWSAQEGGETDDPPPPATVQPYATTSALSPDPGSGTAAAPDRPVQPASLPIGIVAGHWGNDSGAVCDGWLQEVDINLAVAQRVVNTLSALGYETHLLEEFDPRLEGYRARLLVSIHADACMYPEASGFKVARVADSAVPELEDRLVACLIDRYQARTGLAFHEGSITPDMTHYHTFYEIDPSTPGAIIEIGFMLADREILLHNQDLVAQGIIEGILCFLGDEQ